MPGESILLVDDDESVREMLGQWFEAAGYSITCLANEAEARAKLMQDGADAIILDLDLTGGKAMPAPIRETQGYQFLTWLKRETQNQELRDTPVLILTNIDKNEEQGKQRSNRPLPSNAATILLSGAEDYMKKPYDVDEVMVRIRKLLTNSRFADFSRAVEFEFGGWKLNVESQELRNPKNELIHLTPTEYDLLQLLVRKSRQVVSHNELSFCSLARSLKPGERTIHQFMTQIRQKLEDDHENPSMIKTVHGRGYKLAIDARLVPQETGTIPDHTI